jgi:hypothetical protein
LASGRLSNARYTGVVFAGHTPGNGQEHLHERPVLEHEGRIPYAGGRAFVDSAAEEVGIAEPGGM